MSPLIRGILAAFVTGAFVWWMGWSPTGWHALLFPAAVALTAGLGAGSVMILVLIFLAAVFLLFCWSMFGLDWAWLWFMGMLTAFVVGLIITMVSTRMVRGSTGREPTRHRYDNFGNYN